MTIPTNMWPLMYVMTALCIAVVGGCGESGHTLNDDEWSQVIGMPAENTKAASELVQRDAESRQQWLSLHDDFQSERSEIGHQRDLLERDRRRWDRRERQEAIIAAGIAGFSILLVASLPLLLMAFLLWPRRAEPSGEAAREIIVEHWIAQEHRRLATDQEHRRLVEGS